ncbi:Hypothetical predicted protein [Paramuricea clavata]|uniref:Uncharacterized protein n=1 Tax=Paramuricea clavata TaxID=317549 RepID=A0A6S7IHG9_PARCT|nr:Hypothetical predicted protein [Paramuricea clavata]
MEVISAMAFIVMSFSLIQPIVVPDAIMVEAAQDLEHAAAEVVGLEPNVNQLIVVPDAKMVEAAPHLKNVAVRVVGQETDVNMNQANLLKIVQKNINSGTIAGE